MIAAVMFPGLSRVAILIDFKINQDFIAKVLCINRDEPLTMCNGKCYLSEQLNKVEEQEEKQLPNSKNEKVEVLYFHAKKPFDFLKYADNYISKPSSHNEYEFYDSSFITDIFHPPKVNLI